MIELDVLLKVIGAGLGIFIGAMIGAAKIITSQQQRHMDERFDSLQKSLSVYSSRAIANEQEVLKLKLEAHKDFVRRDEFAAWRDGLSESLRRDHEKIERRLDALSNQIERLRGQ